MQIKRVITGTLLLALLAGSSSAANVHPLNQAAYATCLLLGDKGRERMEASCVVVSYDKDTGLATALTAGHCYEPGYRYQVWPSYSAKPVVARFTQVTADKDVCDLGVLVFKPPKPVWAVVGISAAAPRRGCPIMLLGYPGGHRTLRGLRGRVISAAGGAITATAVCVPGDSGGALVDEQGHLVGIISATNYQESYSTGIGAIRQALGW